MVVVMMSMVLCPSDVGVLGVMFLFYRCVGGVDGGGGKNLE